MSKSKITFYLSFLIAVLLLAVVAMQFFPFWSINDDHASIGTYVWNPKGHKELTSYFKNEFADQIVGKYPINSVATMPCIVFLCSILGAVLCILKPRKLYSLLLPAFVGIYGSVVFFTNPIFQSGKNWIFHAIILLMVFMASFIAFCLWCSSVVAANKAKQLS